MDYSDALAAVKQGARITRDGWNGRGMYVEYCNGHVQAGTVFEPFLMLRTVQGTYVPWLASHTDQLAADWGIVVAVEGSFE